MGTTSGHLRPRRALVLAAGFGTRLRPLTDLRPKALLPFWGEPMLHRCIRLLGTWGVRDIVVNAHHLPDQIVGAARRLAASSGLRISVSFEPRILGTGGALKRVEGWLDEPLWVMNADVVAMLDPKPLLAAWRKTRSPAVLWMHAGLGPRTVERSGNLITNFRSSRPGTEGTATFCGLQLLDPGLRAYLSRSEQFETLVDLYERAQQNGQPILGVEAPGSFWADIGAPEQYLEAHRAWWTRHLEDREHYPLPPSLIQRRKSAEANGTRVSGFAALGEHVSVAPGAHLEDVILDDGCLVRARARARHLIAAPGTVLAGPAQRLIAPAACICTRPEQTALAKAGLIHVGSSAQMLPPRGSARSFIRVQTGRRRVILIRSSDERPENALYAAHTRFLIRQGLHVPDLLLDGPEDGFLVMEDLGDRSLQDALPGLSARRRLHVYRQVIDQVLLLHDKGLRAAQRHRVPLMSGFDRRLYAWEHALFFEHLAIPMLGRLPRTRALEAELNRLAERLLKQPRVLVHRDLQSSNILLHQGAAYLIDYQGMRAGAAAYDLASLLCDPYAHLEESEQVGLLDLYASGCRDGDRVREMFWPAAVQRLLQALGAFGRLSRLPGCQAFGRHIPSALHQLQRALSRTGERPCLTELCESLTLQSRQDILRPRAAGARTWTAWQGRQGTRT